MFCTLQMVEDPDTLSSRVTNEASKVHREVLDRTFWWLVQDDCAKRIGIGTSHPVPSCEICSRSL